MKILITTDHPQSASLLIPELKHHVIVALGRILSAQLLYDISRAEPHVLIIALRAIDHDTQSILDYITQKLLDIRIINLLDENGNYPTQWKAKLKKALHGEWPLFLPHLVPSGQRLVYHDADFDHLASEHKLNRPIRDEHYEAYLRLETIRFTRLLRGGREYHREARQYWQCVDDQWSDIETEIVYRQVHGSYKSISLARDLVIRFCSVLAHYVPSAEAEYFVKPNGASGHLTFIHKEIQPEGAYAINLLLGLRLNTSMAGALNSMIDLNYFGQNMEDLLLDSSTALGLARSLSIISESHLGLMDTFLDPGASPIINENITRREKRRIDVFRDFWDLTYLFDADWRKVLTSFHKGEWDAEETHPLTYQSFLKHRRGHE